jgi:hypothetical protein
MAYEEKTMRPTIVLCCLALLQNITAQAAECSVSSGKQRTALLELYTSEGCSSCPPADRWLSRMNKVKNVVPLAWHVDYWDYLGWRDRFAQPEFSARQREMARLNDSSFVYTPQVMLNGRDFRAWKKTGSLEQAVADAQRLPPRATIHLSVSNDTSDALGLNLRAQASQAGPNAIFVAVYQNGLSTQVERGENAGGALRHDYVVREWRGPFRLAAHGETMWKQEIPSRSDLARASGVAAFVQNTATGEILQAVALPLCFD